jgi:CDK-activating kinase assembly factor MAT1
MEVQELEEQKIRRAEDEERSRLLRQAALLEDQEERKEMSLLRRNVIQSLASNSGNAHRIAREGEAALRKAGRKKEILANDKPKSSQDGLLFQGLRKKAAKPEPEKPYDPFGGMSDVKDFVIMPDMVPDLWEDFLGGARTAPRYTAGGYSVSNFLTRALCDLYGGLDIVPAEADISGTESMPKDVAMVDVFS